MKKPAKTSGAKVFLRAAECVAKGDCGFSCTAIAKVAKGKQERRFYERLFNLGYMGYSRFFCVDGASKPTEEEARNRRVIALCLAYHVWKEEKHKPTNKQK